MASVERTHELEELLAGARWVRALARGLVGDASRADDVVQDACVIALERSAQALEPTAWLTGVVRRLAHREARSSARRRRRETAHARGEALPSTDELVARSELQERLSAAVRSLPEPYRDLVLLHYAEGLRLEEIALRLHVPASTVRTRHARALALLRARLDAEHGGRATWLAALAPLAGVPAPSLAPAAATATLGSLAMGAKTGFGIAAIVAGAAVIGVAVALREPSPAGPGATPSAAIAAERASEVANASTPQEGAADALSTRTLAAGSREPAAVTGPLLLFGSITTASGAPVDGAQVRLWNDEGERRTATAAPGSWSIVGLPPGSWTVAVDARGYYPLRDPLELTATAAETRHDLVLEPARVLRIRFVDEEGNTVVGAGTRRSSWMPGLGVVATLTPPGARVLGVDGRMPQRGEAGQYLSPETYGHVDGLPGDCAGLLELSRPGTVYVSAVLRDTVLETRVDPGVGDEMVFVLDEATLRSKLARLRVRVVDASTGAPLEGDVSLSFRDGGSSGSEARGPEGVVEFIDQIPGLRELRVAAKDHAQVTRVVRLEPGETLDLGTLALPRAHTVEGRIVDEAGHAVSGNLRAGSSDLVEGPLDLAELIHVPVSTDGVFRVWSLGAGEPLLLLHGDGYALNPLRLEVDGEGHATAVARTGTPVLLRHGAGKGADRSYCIADSAGRPFCLCSVHDEAPIRLRLVPGRYQLLEGHDERFTLVRTFEVADQPVVLEP